MFKTIEQIKISKKQDVLFLSIGFLLWAVGDLITTWHGFQIGLTEMNSFFSDLTLLEMVGVKIIIFLNLLIFVLISTINEWHYLKIPIYTSLISVGLFAVINNSYLILGEI